jgi:hypothetical protein
VRRTGWNKKAQLEFQPIVASYDNNKQAPHQPYVQVARFDLKNAFDPNFSRGSGKAGRHDTASTKWPNKQETSFFL